MCVGHAQVPHRILRRRGEEVLRLPTPSTLSMGLETRKKAPQCSFPYYEKPIRSLLLDGRQLLLSGSCRPSPLLYNRWSGQFFRTDTKEGHPARFFAACRGSPRRRLAPNRVLRTGRPFSRGFRLAIQFGPLTAAAKSPVDARGGFLFEQGVTNLLPRVPTARPPGLVRFLSADVVSVLLHP